MFEPTDMWNHQLANGDWPSQLPKWLQATTSHDIIEFAEDRLVLATITLDPRRVEEHLWAAALLESELYTRGFSLEVTGPRR